jgi:hypothetical protein
MVPPRTPSFLSGLSVVLEPLELLGQPYLDDLHTELPKHRRVLAEVPRDGQNANLHDVNGSQG